MLGQVKAVSVALKASDKSQEKTDQKTDPKQTADAKTAAQAPIDFVEHLKRFFGNQHNETKIELIKGYAKSVQAELKKRSENYVPKLGLLEKIFTGIPFHLERSDEFSNLLSICIGVLKSAQVTQPAVSAGSGGKTTSKLDTKSIAGLQNFIKGFVEIALRDCLDGDGGIKKDIVALLGLEPILEKCDAQEKAEVRRLVVKSYLAIYILGAVVLAINTRLTPAEKEQHKNVLSALISYLSHAIPDELAKPGYVEARVRNFAADRERLHALVKTIKIDSLYQAHAGNANPNKWGGKQVVSLNRALAAAEDVLSNQRLDLPALRAVLENLPRYYKDFKQAFSPLDESKCRVVVGEIKALPADNNKGARKDTIDYLKSLADGWECIDSKTEQPVFVVHAKDLMARYELFKRIEAVMVRAGALSAGQHNLFKDKAELAYQAVTSKNPDEGEVAVAKLEKDLQTIEAANKKEEDRRAAEEAARKAAEEAAAKELAAIDEALAGAGLGGGSFGVTAPVKPASAAVAGRARSETITGGSAAGLSGQTKFFNRPPTGSVGSKSGAGGGSQVMNASGNTAAAASAAGTTAPKPVPAAALKLTAPKAQNK